MDGDDDNDPAREASEWPPVGSRVRCGGLAGAAAQLNGCQSRVVGHERARVLIDGPTSRDADVKPQNLVVVLGLLDLLQAPDFFKKEVLERLNPTELALLAQADHRLRAAVVASGWSRAGTGHVRFELEDFVGSVALLAWAVPVGCVDVCRHCWGRTPGGSSVGSGAALPMVRVDVCGCC
jgi:hypothetical protein